MMSSPRHYGDSRVYRSKITQLAARGRHLLAVVDRHQDAYAGPERIDSARLTVAFHLGPRLSGGNTDLAKWELSIKALLSDVYGARAHDFTVTRFPSKEAWPQEAAALFALERHTIESNLSLLDDIRAALPSGRLVASERYMPQLDELRESGLMTTEVIDGYAARMSRLRTRPQMAGAIAASKELTEAVLKAALSLLGTTVLPDMKYPDLAKAYRAAVTAHPKYAPDALTVNIIEEIERRATILIDHLAPLRNRHGDGHGHLRYSRNLQSRHARLAADIAESYARFVASTLRDIGLT